MNKEVRTPKLMIFGIDGGTFDLVKPLIEEGALPHLARLLDKGAHSPLESTVPPLTAPAWTTFFTGKNPGKHGIYDFVWQSTDQSDRPLVNAASIRGRTVWQLLSDAGFSVGLINVPMTYPPQPLNGYVIAGMLTPSEESALTHPPELQAELTAGVGDYPLDINLIKILQTQDDTAFVDALFYGAEQRRKTAHYMLTTRPVDVFALVFTMVDRLQHRFWRCMASGPEEDLHPWNAKFRFVIEEGYKKIDAYIGELIERYGGDADIIILSDHGFGPLYRDFFINRWLRDEGFMNLRYPERQPGKSWSEHVDWSGTAAYSCFFSSEESIFINLKGREPHGIVDPGESYEKVRESIIKKLRDLKDPIDGRPVVERVMKREDIYHGALLDKAPDIQFLSRNLEYSLRGNPYAGSHVIERNPIGQESGYHRMKGMLILKGRHVAKGAALNHPGLIDLAPTILYLLDKKIPDDMDGRVILEAIEKDFAAAHPVRFEEAPAAKVDQDQDLSSADVYSESEKTLIKETLKGLGYFD